MRLMRESNRTRELPRDDELVALTHRAYPALVGCLDALISGKRRVQVFDCARFLLSPSSADYARAVAAFERFLRDAMHALRAHAVQEPRLANAVPENVLVRCASAGEIEGEPVVTLARGGCESGYDACVTGLVPLGHAFRALLATREGGVVRCKETPVGTSLKRAIDIAIFHALLYRAKGDAVVVLVRNDDDGERIADMAEVAGWRTARILRKNEGEDAVPLDRGTVVVWNTEGRGWLTRESGRVVEACTLTHERRVSRCFALLYECEAEPWVAAALGQIVGPMDERRSRLGVTFFR